MYNIQTAMDAYPGGSLYMNSTSCGVMMSRRSLRRVVHGVELYATTGNQTQRVCFTGREYKACGMLTWRRLPQQHKKKSSHREGCLSNINDAH